MPLLRSIAPLTSTTSGIGRSPPINSVTSRLSSVPCRISRARLCEPPRGREEDVEARRRGLCSDYTKNRLHQLRPHRLRQGTGTHLIHNLQLHCLPQRHAQAKGVSLQGLLKLILRCRPLKIVSVPQVPSSGFNPMLGRFRLTFSNRACKGLTFPTATA